jgi:hypothetical protein
MRESEIALPLHQSETLICSGRCAYSVPWCVRAVIFRLTPTGRSVADAKVHHHFSSISQIFRSDYH